jgi:hypothetical protein
MKKLLLGAFLFLTACSHRDVEPDNQPNLGTISNAEQTVSAPIMILHFHFSKEFKEDIAKISLSHPLVWVWPLA